MKSLKNIYFVTFASFIFFISLGCSQQAYYKDSRFLMGTLIEITCPDQQAMEIAFDEIKRIDGLLSKFNPESEVSRLNAAGKLQVGPDLLYVLKKAKEFYLSSNGAFDVTVGPLVDIWKAAIKNNNLPSDEEIQKAKVLVGFDKVFIDKSDSTVTFLKKGLEIDLGAIAKGYAVDRAIKKVLDFGIKTCLIDAGGDMYCLGKNRDEPWQVGIQHPRNKNDLIDVVRVENKAVATSGDYEQMFILKDEPYSHIINPQTGYPADTGVVSVTVIAPYCLNADALATAIFALGKEKGKVLANYYDDIEAIIYTEEEISVFDSF
ncbi:MAG: FAD:protein FMN transferase [Candidatus Omnitrophota bacterium]